MSGSTRSVCVYAILLVAGMGDRGPAMGEPVTAPATRQAASAQVAKKGQVAKEPPALMPRRACGRDCAYTVMQMLGRQATLEQIDAQLEHRSEASLADLRRCLEAYGLHCQAVLLTAANAARVGTLLRHGHGQRAAIVALPTGQRVGHFVLLLEASPDELVLLDASSGRQYRVASKALRDAPIPSLLVGSQRWAPARAEERRRLPQSILDRAASSWWVGAGLAGAAIAAVAWALGRRPFTLGERIGAWLVWPPRRQWLARTAIAVGTFGLVGLTIWFVAPVLRQPVTADVAVLDLGRRPVGSQQKAVLRLRNRSFFSAQQVSGVQASCSCLTPRCQRPRIPPRGETTIEVDAWIHLAGPAEYNLLVRIGRGEQLLRVPVRFEGYEEASLSLPQVALGSFPRGVGWRKSVRLRVLNYKGQPVPLSVAQRPGRDPVVRAELEQGALLRRNGRLVLRVRTPPDLPLGTFSQRVVLETKEENPRTFVVILHGEIVEPVQMRPRALVLPAASTETSDSLEVQACFGALAIGRVWAAGAELAVEESAADASGRVRVVVRRPAGTPAGTAKLYIDVRRPIEQVLEIPVYLSPVARQE